MYVDVLANNTNGTYLDAAYLIARNRHAIADEAYERARVQYPSLSLNNVDERLNGRSCWMFIDKNTGECYKPASYKAPAKGVRYLITQLADNPHICDAYGSFLYL